LDISSLTQLKNYIRQISKIAIVIISSNVIEQLKLFCGEMLLIENQQVVKISQT
jgi:ABC-type Na+ transport system ATPase subunit NatA